MGKTLGVNSLDNLANVYKVNIKFRKAGADNRGSLQVVGALRPQCIISVRFPTWRKIVAMRAVFLPTVHHFLVFRCPSLYQNVIFGKFESS